MAMTTCQSCGQEIPEGETLCENCAAQEQPCAPHFQPDFSAPDLARPAGTERPAFRIPVTQQGLPAAYKPLGAWAYFGYVLLFNIPVVGLIFLIVFACGGTANVNLRNFARSFFCGYLVLLVLVAIAAALVWGLHLPVPFLEFAVGY